MKWHIINHRDYIDGPFDSYEEALNQACVLGTLLDGAPVTQRLPLTEGLHALGHRLTREAVDAGNEAQVAAGGPGATWPATR